MSRYIIISIFAVIFSFGLTNVVDGVPLVADSEFIVEEYVSGLSLPTTMTFVGDDILVLQKNDGQVKLVRNGQLSPSPVLDFNVANVGEGGLLGITSVDSSVFIYLTESTHDGGPPLMNKVYKFNWNGNELTEQILMKELPASQQYMHNGGAMVSGINGEVYAVIGDVQRRGVLQNLPEGEPEDTSVILRIDKEEPYYAMGIRNSFGIAVDPLSGNLWDTENGPRDFDEINFVPLNFNSGWIKIMGPGTADEISSLPKFGDYVYSDPEFTWERTVAPTGISFINSKSFEKYRDTLFVGDFNFGTIYNFKLNQDRTGFIFEDSGLSDLVAEVEDSITEIIFGIGFGGITDIEAGPDGLLYVVSITDGTIYKISPLEKFSLKVETPKKQLENGVPIHEITCNKDLVPVTAISKNFVGCVKPKNLSKFLERNWGNLIPFTNYANVELVGSNLEGANLTNTDFSFGNLAYSNLKNANLAGLRSVASNLTGSNLSGSYLVNGELRYSNLAKAILDEATLRSTDLASSNLENASFKKADLSEVIFKGSNMRGVDLTEANLTNANLRKAKLQNAIIDNAILVNTDLYLAILSNSSIKKSVLSNANLELAELIDVDLSLSDLSEANLFSSNLKNVNLELANLSGANLKNAKLHKANLKNANLSGANLDGANLFEADLEGVDLSGANLTNANLLSANLENANLTGANLTNANLSKTNLKNAILLKCFGNPICK